MAHDSTLFGWAFPTWERALAWAQSDLSARDMFDERKRDGFVDVRRRWLVSGGPASGPSETVTAAVTSDFRRGVEAAIEIIENRGKRIMGAIQPSLTVAEIRESLLNG